MRADIDYAGMKPRHATLPARDYCMIDALLLFYLVSLRARNFCSSSSDSHF